MDYTIYFAEGNTWVQLVLHKYSFYYKIILTIKKRIPSILNWVCAVLFYSELRKFFWTVCNEVFSRYNIILSFSFTIILHNCISLFYMVWSSVAINTKTFSLIGEIICIRLFKLFKELVYKYYNRPWFIKSNKVGLFDYIIVNTIIIFMKPIKRNEKYDFINVCIFHGTVHKIKIWELFDCIFYILCRQRWHL